MRCELTNEYVEWEAIRTPQADCPATKSAYELLEIICPDCSDCLIKYYDEWDDKIRYRCENCGFMINERNMLLTMTDDS